MSAYYVAKSQKGKIVARIECREFWSFAIFNMRDIRNTNKDNTIGHYLKQHGHYFSIFPYFSDSPILLPPPYN